MSPFNGSPVGKNLGWKALLKTPGLTWKKLTSERRADMDEVKASALMVTHPT